MYNKEKLNQLCNKEINIIFSENGYGKTFHETQQFKKLKYYKKQYKNIINRINSDYKGYKQQFLNLEWLEKDNVEHSDAYKQLQYLLWYIEELKEYE